MGTRPKIKLHLSSLDKGLDMAGFIILLVLWILTLFAYFNMPDTIPIHFNASGVPNNFGSKVSIITLPVLGTIIFWGLTTLNKYPHIFNYSATLTPDNAELQYTYATRILRFLKLAIVIIFTILVLFTYLTVNGKTKWIGPWFLPFTFLLTLSPTVYFIIKALKAK